MSAVNVGDPDLRATGIGGSDVPQILGVSRFGTPMRVYLEKRRQAAPLIETGRMRWGKILEDPVAREYAVQTGRRVVRAAAFIRHPAHEWQYANIDRWSDKRGTARRVLEVKTADVFARADFGEKGTDQVPPDYLLQVMWYLHVTGKDVADLAVLIGGNDFGVYTIERQPELIETMVERVTEFWRDTQAGIPPEVDGSEATGEYLRLTYADDGSERAMDDELERLAMQYENARLEIKALEEARDTVGNRIRELMGNARFSTNGTVKVTHSAIAGATYTDWPALVKAQGIPEAVVAEFTARKAGTRQLRVTVKEGG